MAAGDLVVGLEKAGFDFDSPLSVRRTLLDTFDGRLYARGLRIELRKGSGCVLSVTGDGSTPAHLPVVVVPRFASDLPPGPLRSRLAPVLDVRALLPVVHLDSHQRTAVHRDARGKVVASLTVHDHLALEGTAWAVEVEELAGYAKDTERARALLTSLGLRILDHDLMAQAARAAGTDLRGHSASPTVALDRAEPSSGAFRRVLANLADEVDANWDGTVNDVDAEFLHDLRVAVRRTRSVLAQAKRVLPPKTRDRFRSEFGWLGGATGPARDLDVYVIDWDSYVAPLGAEVTASLAPLVGHLADRRRAEHVSLSTLLHSVRYHQLMASWKGWLAGPVGDGEPGADATTSIGIVAARRIAAADDRLVTRGRSIGADTAAEELHELRKDAKKLRYLLECFGSVLATAERKAFVQRLKALQDNLGEHQDTEVHAAQLRTMSHELHAGGGVGPDALVAMGQLAGEFERRRIAARAEFADRFAAYDTTKTRRTLAAMLESAAGG